ncbi:VOC family protein [Bremerella cremea]|uniref:Extradiol dioxygenase n=1 Tax=Blastopirellula marina TaxID=124 RepID=A0A2S8FPW3_9BACT|nr:MULTISPECIES: VOC family protein [Pirellulaceae]PQO34198.1 extradiol dioxygenase [Blastopirellula marina]RCS46694.1 VOC family protein [Bremerella cremea]
MSTAYKPEGYNSASAYLIVKGAQGTIDFLKQVFSATPLRRIDRENGSIMHAEVKIDDTVIMIADELEGWPAVLSHVHIYVPNVDEVFQKAIAAGATTVQEPSQRSPEDDKRGGFQDTGGTTWWVATQVS